MADDVKRLNYFNGQFLREKDFNDQQGYHLQSDRDHERLLHTPGVAEGLQVTIPSQGATTVVVQSGTAYDDQGRRIVLADNTSAIDLANYPANADVYLTIAFHEELTDYVAETGSNGPTRMRENPVVAHSLNAPQSPGTVLVLGVVKRAGTTCTTVDKALRPVAGMKAGDLTATSVRLSSESIDSGQWSTVRLTAPTQVTVAGDLKVGPKAAGAVASLDVSGNVTVAGTVDGRDVSQDGAALDSHLNNTLNPHAVTAAQIDGGPPPLTNRIVTQINAGTGVVAEPRIDPALARQSALNAHTGAASAAHPATAISATPYFNISSTNVQAQVQEIVSDLMSTIGPTTGAALVGNDVLSNLAGTVPPGSVRNQLSALLGLLSNSILNTASQVGPNTGASLVGNDGFISGANSVAAGNLRTQLPSLLAQLTNHQVSGSAHQAANIPITDGANQINATNVEAALAEMFSIYTGDHFRYVDTYPGQHRTIRQPNFGVFIPGKALILDSAASNYSYMHLRIYVDGDSVWLTLNAAWDGNTNWVRDTGSFPAGGIRFSRNAFEVLRENVQNAFPVFTQRWTLPTGNVQNTGFELSGSPMQEQGRVGVLATNTSSVQQLMYTSGHVTYRSKFPGTPSSISFVREGGANFGGNPSLILNGGGSDWYGFVWMSLQNPAAGVHMTWWGWYVAQY